MPQGLISLVQPGPTGTAHALARFALRRWFRLRSRGAPVYRPPDASELAQIETALVGAGMPCIDFSIDATEFQAWQARFPFPADYHGGEGSGVYTEKLLEHYVAWRLLGLGSAGALPYLDIAACSSPWARVLRGQGLQADAIDLAVAPEHAGLDYYHQGDATRSPFADSSIGSASLQCAFEMFAGDHDRELVAELARILRPGGRAVISPLYMHTHACHYQTPEYFGRFPGDPGATAYVRPDTWGVATSRKYSARTLRDRVWEPALRAGLVPSLHVLRNAAALGRGIYLHFILVLDKPAEPASDPGASQ